MATTPLTDAPTLSRCRTPEIPIDAGRSVPEEVIRVFVRTTSHLRETRAALHKSKDAACGFHRDVNAILCIIGSSPLRSSDSYGKGAWARRDDPKANGSVAADSQTKSRASRNRATARGIDGHEGCTGRHVQHCVEITIELCGNVCDDRQHRPAPFKTPPAVVANADCLADEPSCPLV